MSEQFPAERSSWTIDRGVRCTASRDSSLRTIGEQPTTSSPAQEHRLTATQVGRPWRRVSTANYLWQLERVVCVRSSIATILTGTSRPYRRDRPVEPFITKQGELGKVRSNEFPSQQASFTENLNLCVFVHFSNLITVVRGPELPQTDECVGLLATKRALKPRCNFMLRWRGRVGQCQHRVRSNH